MGIQVEAPRRAMTVERAFEKGRKDARRNRSFYSVTYKDRSIIAAWQRGFEAERSGKPDAADVRK